MKNIPDDITNDELWLFAATYGTFYNVANTFGNDNQPDVTRKSKDTEPFGIRQKKRTEKQ